MVLNYSGKRWYKGCNIAVDLSTDHEQAEAVQHFVQAGCGCAAVLLSKGILETLAVEAYVPIGELIDEFHQARDDSVQAVC